MRASPAPYFRRNRELLLAGEGHLKAGTIGVHGDLLSLVIPAHPGSGGRLEPGGPPMASITPGIPILVCEMPARMQWLGIAIIAVAKIPVYTIRCKEARNVAVVH
jgi:hypothetical protein